MWKLEPHLDQECMQGIFEIPGHSDMQMVAEDRKRRGEVSRLFGTHFTFLRAAGVDTY